MLMIQDIRSDKEMDVWVAVCGFVGKGDRNAVLFTLISVLKAVSSGAAAIRVLKKVNNVESPGKLSSCYHIPSENRSLSFFIGPILLTRALQLLCNIEEKGEEQREEIPLASSVLQYCDFFISLYVTITSSRDEKNLIFTKPGR